MDELVLYYWNIPRYFSSSENYLASHLRLAIVFAASKTQHLQYRACCLMVAAFSCFFICRHLICSERQPTWEQWFILYKEQFRIFLFLLYIAVVLLFCIELCKKKLLTLVANWIWCYFKIKYLIWPFALFTQSCINCWLCCYYSVYMHAVTIYV